MSNLSPLKWTTHLKPLEKSEKAERNKEINEIVDKLLSDDMTTEDVNKYFANYKNENGEELYEVLKYNVPAKTLRIRPLMLT